MENKTEVSQKMENSIANDPALSCWAFTQNIGSRTSKGTGTPVSTAALVTEPMWKSITGQADTQKAASWHNGMLSSRRF